MNHCEAPMTGCWRGEPMIIELMTLLLLLENIILALQVLHREGEGGGGGGGCVLQVGVGVVEGRGGGGEGGG